MKLKSAVGVIGIVWMMVTSVFSQVKPYTMEDTLSGSNTPYRAWWNVTHYQLTVQPDYKTRALIGNNIITYTVSSDSLPFIMQVDLQEPMQIDSLFLDASKKMTYQKEGNRWMMTFEKQEKKSTHTLQVYFSGKPKVALNPPWDGGWVWKKDSLGNPWMSAACQGNGASIWYPCKDLQSDEPDNGCILSIIVPDTLIGIGNGQLIRKEKAGPGRISYTWEVKNTINSYDIIPYIGKYTCLHDSVIGEKGNLLTDYWVLKYHINQGKQHLKPDVMKTIRCLEHWFGPYPFYEDGYKIVEAPYLGMEHQSNIAYGNRYLNGYAGRDLSNTGWGLKWDFIVVHETAHEWFGNSITAEDVADNWIHEGFASYAESLFTECEFGKEAGMDYVEGVRKSIDNDISIIGKYGVKTEGSGDMYNKGSQVIQMIREWMNDDEQFRLLLRELSFQYAHHMLTTQAFETWVSQKTGKDLKAFFDQYLRTIQVPQLEYKLSKNKLSFRYTRCVNGFQMPLKLAVVPNGWIYPTTQWQTVLLPRPVKTVALSRAVYVDLLKVK